MDKDQMLTKVQLIELRARFQDPTHGSISATVATLIDEIEAQRPVVLAALACTGEDGHDGTVNLVVAAEEYLDKLCASDASWRTKYGTANIDRKYE
jgi:hypothetical protein